MSDADILNRMGTDAQQWAQEFMSIFGEALRDEPACVVDEGLMIGWFANAIMAGHDEGQGRLMSETERADSYRRWLTDAEKRIHMALMEAGPRRWWWSKRLTRVIATICPNGSYHHEMVK